MDKNSVYVVIPAYNESLHIKDIARKSLKHCQNVIVVDDGSSDDTGKQVLDLPVTLITLPINQGKGYALSVGVDYAFAQGAKAVIMLDGDGQHKPDHIPQFISVLKKFPVVLGVRKGNHPIPKVRKFGNFVASELINFLYNIKIEDLLCGYRGFTVQGYKAIKWISKKYGVETEMVARLGMSKIPYCKIEIENIYLEQFKGVTMLDALEVFLSIPKFKIPTR